MTGAKFEKAKEWNIPTVDMSWIEDMARHGVIAPVNLPAPNDVPAPKAYAPPEPSQARSQGKGKGKGKEIELAMADITNSERNNILGHEASY